MEEGFRTPPSPVEVGETYEVEITDTGKEGDGIARVDNFVLFVKGAGIGETVTVEVTDVKNTFGIAKVAEE